MNLFPALRYLNRSIPTCGLSALKMLTSVAISLQRGSPLNMTVSKLRTAVYPPSRYGDGTGGNEAHFAQEDTKGLDLCTHFLGIAAAAAKSLQSCPTLRPRIDGSPPGSPVPGILQARTLEWVAISFSNA